MSLNLLLLLGFGIITGGVLSLVGGIKFFEFQRKARKQPYKQRRKRPVLFFTCAAIVSVAGFLMIMFIQESQYLSVFIDAISGGALVGLIVAVFHEYFGMDQHTEDFNGIAASKVDLVGARNHADKQAGISKKTRKNFTKNKAVQGKLPKNGRDGRK